MTQRTMTPIQARVLEQLTTPLTTTELWDRLVVHGWLGWSTMYQALRRLHDLGVVGRIPELGDQSIRPVMWWAL